MLPFISPQVSFILVFLTQHCSDDSRVQSHTSQAGDKMVRVVQIISHGKGLRNQSCFIYSFLCGCSQILNWCQSAVSILWDMFCSWASQKNHLMPSRKSFPSWSILMTTFPMNTFKRLWSSFRSSTLFWIANKLKKEKTAAQSKTEKSYM